MIKRKLFSLSFLTLLFVSATYAQDPIFSEIMFAPNGANNEYVELYNPTNQTIDLANYQIKYSTATGDYIQSINDGTMLLPNSFAVVVEGDFDINASPYNFPASALIVKIDDNAFGSSGMANTSDREMFILDNNDAVIATYTYSANNSNGISDEKIIMNNDNSSSNWANSTTMDGTPGSKNSVSPKENDVTITNIAVSPNPQITGQVLSARITVKNLGTTTASSFSLSLYDDANFNSNPEGSELISTATITNLASKDSTTRDFEVGSYPIGDVRLIAVATLAGDENNNNNQLSTDFYVNPIPAAFNDVVINEIMYDPSTGEPEWVEIYNRSQKTYSLADWEFSDASSTVTITTDEIEIQPDEYIILARNNDIENFYDITAQIITFSLPSLNNTGDKLRLRDNTSSIVDSLTYTSGWGGGDGVSLERISVDQPSHLETNWGSSESPVNASPGSVNSISSKEYDLAVSNVSYSPIIPIEGDDVVISVNVKNLGTLNSGDYLLNFFWDQNKDSVAQISERLQQLNLPSISSGDSVITDFNFPDVEPGVYSFIFTLQSGRDEYDFNNILLSLLPVGGTPAPYNSLVINEIMYAPQDDQPEWVEIFNRSNEAINIKGWHLSDASNSSKLTNQNIIIQPDSFLVISDNDKITEYYNFDFPFIAVNIPALNNGGDKLILSDSLFFVNDSLEYSSDWGGAGGRSIERIDVDSPSNIESNWSESTSSAGATPGKVNSVLPKQFDLALLSFNSSATWLFTNEESILNTEIKNIGVSAINNGALDIYLDSNGDSLFTNNELYTSYENLSLSPGETLNRDVTFTFSTPGIVNFLAVVHLANDEYNDNDSLFLSKEVIDPSVARGEIVINEFLYAPISPYPEWIELFNTADVPQQLRSFSIADSRDTVRLSTENILLPENSYFVIARDSILFELYDIPEGVGVLIKEFPSLNNSGDRIMLLDNYDRVIDSLDYTSAWGGNDGQSLERINPFGNSNSQTNWVTSTDPAKGTPGKINSIAPKDYDVAVTDFYSIPAQPVTGESVEFYVQSENKGVINASFSIELYESNADSNLTLLLESKQVDNLTPGETREIKFNFKIDAFAGDKYFLSNVNFPADLDTTNNRKILLVASSAAPLSLVINEIMFAPSDDEPEWIELYNRSSNSINLKDWIVSDVITTPAPEVISTEDVFVDPGDYVVLSKDSGIFNYHPDLTEGVIIVPFANLNNTEDGVVIFDRLNTVIDSVFYTDGFPRKSGYSIERLSTEASSNDSSNWNYSISPERGTPGFINSRIPKDHDLVLDGIFINPEFPELGNTVTLSAAILNAGLIDAQTYTVNFNSPELGINENVTGNNLVSEQIDTLELPLTITMPESFSITVTVNYSPDENLSNNLISTMFFSGYAPQSILINEVMYDPNEDGTEWVEFVNVSNAEIILRDWMISEKSNSDDPDILTSENVIAKSGDFIIVADDTSGGKFLHSPNVHVFQVNFGELNSTEDIITLYDFRGAVIDSLEYFSSWGGGDGFSLERISLQAPTNERSNWLASIVQNGSTPGSTNSTINIAPVDRAQIVINEIMFNPESDNSEFVELFNTSDKFIEIANWSVEDESKNNTVLSRTTFTIAPNSYFVVAADSSILINYPELKEFDQLLIVNKSMSLNNSDDLIMLLNSFDEIIDSVHYDSDWHNSRLLTTKNKSLERINPFLDGNDKNNWSTSVASEGATPGKANSIFIDNQTSGKTISVTPNPFSPDGDGYEDFAIINYRLPKEVSSIQIKVFDSKGRKVRTINEDNLYRSSGSIIFDGYNDDRQPLKIGIYILFIEALDSSSGTTDTFKEVIVVARKL